MKKGAVSPFVICLLICFICLFKFWEEGSHSPSLIQYRCLRAQPLEE